MKKSFSILIVILLTTGSIGTTQTFIRNFGRNFSKKIGLKEAFSSIRPFTSKALNYTKENWTKWYLWKTYAEYGILGVESAFKFAVPFYALFNSNETLNKKSIKKACSEGALNIWNGWLFTNTVKNPMKVFFQVMSAPAREARENNNYIGIFGR
ncbi:hypothetical protein KC460_04205 [Candidatus Dependentiae bacterium]|nr:hypothetical protein [Candidatus Dependentiae bacterium]